MVILEKCDDVAVTVSETETTQFRFGDLCYWLVGTYHLLPRHYGRLERDSGMVTGDDVNVDGDSRSQLNGWLTCWQS